MRLATILSWTVVLLFVMVLSRDPWGCSPTGCDSGQLIEQHCIAKHDSTYAQKFCYAAAPRHSFPATTESNTALHATLGIENSRLSVETECRRLQRQFLRHLIRRHDWKVIDCHVNWVFTACIARVYKAQCNPERTKQMSDGDADPLTYTSLVGGGPPPRVLFISVLQGRISNKCLLIEGDRVSFVSHLTSENISEADWNHPDIAVAELPLKDLVLYLSAAQIKAAYTLHHIEFSARLSVDNLRKLADVHQCVNCGKCYTVFKVIRQYEAQRKRVGRDRARIRRLANPVKIGQTAQTKAKASLALSMKRKQIRAIREAKPTCSPEATPFPPAALNTKDIHTIITDYCNAINPVNLQEAGCCVCGTLTPLAELTPKNEVMFDWNLLRVVGAARVERKTSDDMYQDYNAPVIDPQCTHVCVSCEEHLLKGNVPTHSLANFNWIGLVPLELQNLTFAEKMMIARVRHNRCVVRVASGRGKLMANAVMYATPIPKIYSVLPPSSEELSEVLAYVFLGSALPSMDEHARTPMFVRRDKVRLALEWLKLNHCDYEDIEISNENLMALPEQGLPCGFNYKSSDVEDTNKVAEAMAVNETDEPDGTSTGPCPFVVSGLTADGLTELENSKNQSVLKTRRANYLLEGNIALGIGHSETAQSLFRNTALYPKMFPWLFPYGFGGLSQSVHKNKISDETRKRKLLLYYDKRFQLDDYFTLIAFNDSQIKSASAGSFLMVKRKNMEEISRKFSALDNNVLANLAERLEQGEHVKPVTEAERACFSVLKEIDYISGKVDGSMTARKYMRNEVWSLVSFKGAPSWFLTFAPADANHPLCMYFADQKLTYSPEILTKEQRDKLVMANPTAAARFFHHICRSFIKHVLKVDTELPGLYGQSDAYYGTVEQQGRLTLHLHMLLWIKGAASPQEIRERIVNNDSEFQRDLINYLEQSHTGDFLVGSKKAVEELIAKRKQDPGYINPELTLPTPPPEFCNCKSMKCIKCAALQNWWKTVFQETDELIYKSNIHEHRTPRQGTDFSRKLKPGAKIKREIRGCRRKDGSCSARFPRELFRKTEVNLEDGSIRMKKQEPMLNTFNPAATYVLRCNSDSTSLLSGTAIKAVVAYISDYVTKSSLKLYHVFYTLRDVLAERTIFVGKSTEAEDNNRRVVMSTVNQLTAKFQIGSPMAAAYVLGEPDHYTNMKFKVFPWKTYVSRIMQESGDESEQGAPTEQCTDSYSADYADMADNPERVVLFRTKDKTVVGASSVDDYIHRPATMTTLSLFDFFQMATRKKRTQKMQLDFLADLEQTENNIPKNVDGLAEDDPSWIDIDVDYSTGQSLEEGVTCSSFGPGHPLFKSHYLHMDTRCLENTALNYVYGTLPRKDQGDREFYCCTMLTLFKPWREAKDLKMSDDSWSEAFEDYSFTERQSKLMDNFNVRYECNDARDDYSAQEKKRRREQAALEREQHPVDDDECDSDSETDDEWDELSQEIPDQIKKGSKQQRMEDMYSTVTGILERTKWIIRHCAPSSVDVAFEPSESLTGSSWRKRLQTAKETLIMRKLQRLGDKWIRRRHHNKIPDLKLVDSVSAQNQHSNLRPQTRELMDQIIMHFNLNTEQERAFRIVATHSASSEVQPQLKMYLGGMGGTGKSQVIKALKEWFTKRGEEHRFVVLAPTGTAAALVGGSTYHMFLGIRDGMDKNAFELHVNQVRDRLRGVEYIFLDEVSMVSCTSLYKIAAKLAKALDEHETAFGGMNMIFCGDFGQLPPVLSKSLWSSDVEVPIFADTKMTELDQTNTIGKIVWLGVTTVVLLTQNMRQQAVTPEDAALRVALMNMRYGSCTPADLAYLNSRTISSRPGHPTFTSGEFRTTPTITGPNVVKDKINDMGCSKFAEETGQTLIDFYSVDELPENDSGRRQARGKGRAKRQTKRLTDQQKDLLHNCPPSMTGKIPGKLSLCLGMPVVIRYNEATELCVTKGQDGIVRGWSSSRDNTGRQYLEVLFVELMNPPSNVKVDGLPQNIVPLTPRSELITWDRYDGSQMRIKRQQVMVLPYFGGTDYSFQGKSLPRVIVDAFNLKTHSSYYVALSRCTSSAGTVLLQAVNPRKITSGISGWLRQEFRELEILNDITRMRYEGTLPPHINGINRRVLIRKFREWKGSTYQPANIHPAIQWGQGMPRFIAMQEQIGTWGFVGEDINNRKESTKHQHVSPPQVLNLPQRGLIWDSQNHSCAYDSMFTILWFLWHDLKFDDSAFQCMGVYMKMLALNFARAYNKEISLELARDEVRSAIRASNPSDFPIGEVPTNLDNLTLKLLGGRTWGTKYKMCRICRSKTNEQNAFDANTYIWPDENASNRFGSKYCTLDWISSMAVRESSSTCNLCHVNKTSILTFHTLPAMFWLGIEVPHILISRYVHLSTGGEVAVYRVAGLVYSGGSHFTARIVLAGGTVWFHDGIGSEGVLTPEGSWGEHESLDLWECRGRRLAGVLYVKS